MLEGISSAGKTSTMYAIKKLFSADKKLERNVIMLGEHYTQVLNSINGELKYHNCSEHVEMLFKRVEMIENLYEWACYLGDFRRTSRGLYTVFERGLLNYLDYYKDFDSAEMIELQARFNKLCIEEILLVISDELIEKRVRLRSEQVKDKLPQMNVKKLAEEYKYYQDSLLNSVTRISLPYRIIYTDSMNWDKYADMIVNGNNADV